MEIFILANLCGIFALMTDFISTQIQSKKGILFYNGVSNAMCVLQYLLLGAFTGAISCFIAIIRNIVFTLYKKAPIWILWLYLILVFVLNLFFITDAISIIPVVATAVYGICLYQPKVRILKIGTILVDIIGALFDFYSKAYVTMVKGIFVTGGAVIGYFRYEKNHKKKKFGIGV